MDKTSIYDRSIFKMSNEVSSQISRRGSFTKTDIDNRTNILANFIKSICPCLKTQQSGACRLPIS